MSTPTPPIAQSTGVINADPSKDFFVSMITRDISLTDCIFDLLDNSVDSARKSIQGSNSTSLAAFKVEINLSHDRFQMIDNCGGIPLSSAIDYAFRFGRRKGAPSEVQKSIGLYGIGMKRAIFKMGRRCQVISETEQDSFSVGIDVDDWERQSDWDLAWNDHPRRGVHGAEIIVNDLYKQIAVDFADSTFANGLVKAIARDYAFFIREGLKIVVNDVQVPEYKYEVKASSEFSPASVEYVDDSVRVRLVAGIIDALPDDVPEELRPEDIERFGWFVICNGRVVIPADKSARTVWGVDNFQVFHPQYRGFAGFAFFDSDQPELLPWTTTKRDIETAEPLYRRAVEKMKELTRSFITYSGQRRGDLDTAKTFEKSAPAVDVASVSIGSQMKFPTIPILDKIEMINILYKKPKKEIEEIKSAFGNVYMSAKDVGVATFEYYRRMELGK
jgi:hypothetical protein